MRKTSSLKERVKKLEEKPKDIDKIKIDNFIVIMKEFSMSYEEVKRLPLFVYDRLLAWLNEQNEKAKEKNKDKNKPKPLRGLSKHGS